MLQHFFRRHERIEALRGGPTGSLLEGFAEKLSHAGYAKITARRHIRAAEHLLHWTERRGVPISDVTESFLERFEQHVKRCRCRSFGRSVRALLRGARVFTEYLHSTGLLTASVEQNQDPALLVAFRQWMIQQRGSCDRTLYEYGFCIRALLQRLGDDPSRFDAQGLRQFVMETSRQSGRAKTKMYTKALRMFLRFLVAEGKCAVGLEAAIPVLAHWRLSALPRYLLEEDVERVIASCDPSTPVGRRDRAMLLLLARLGLRAGDIARLRLGAIDWREATVLVSGKGRLETRLPLTQEVGDAVAEYLTTGRPHPTPMWSFSVFVHRFAPSHPFVSQPWLLRRCAEQGLCARVEGRPMCCATLWQLPCCGTGHRLRRLEASCVTARSKRQRSMPK